MTKTAELFKAKFLRLSKDSKWVTTELADNVLARLGVVTLTARSLLAQQDLPQQDLVFLDACIASTEVGEVGWSLPQTALLRAALFLAHRASPPERLSAQTRRRLLYSAIVGLNPSSQKLGERAYCDHVFARQSSSLEGLRDDYHRRHFLWSCSRAMHDVGHSNLIFLHGAAASQSQTPIAYLTWTRILSALACNRVDPSLKATTEVAGGDTGSAWRTLRLWEPDFEWRCQEFAMEVGKAPDTNVEKGGRTGLRERFLHVLSREHTSAEMPLWHYLSSRETPDRLTASNPYFLWSLELGRLKADVLSGELDALTEKQRDNLANELSSISSILGCRVSQPPRIERNPDETKT